MTIFLIVGYTGYFYAERVIEVEWSKYNTQRYILARSISTHESVFVDSRSIWYKMYT